MVLRSESTCLIGPTTVATPSGRRVPGPLSLVLSMLLAPAVHALDAVAPPAPEATAPAAAAAPPAQPGPSFRARVEAEHVTAELVGADRVLVPGHTAWFALRLRHEPHWHSYWLNPGDSGQATRLNWQLPEGYSAGAVAWPAPARFDVDGLANFGYADEVLLPVPITVPATARIGDSVPIQLDARWLVCKEICVPGRGSFTLSRVVSKKAAPDPDWNRPIADWRARAPLAAAWSGKATLNGDMVELALQVPANGPVADSLDLFPITPSTLEHARPQFSRERTTLTVLARRSAYYAAPPERLEFVLSSAGGGAWRLSVPFQVASSP